MAQDLDQSGHGYQRVRTYLGPSLGWTEELVQPAKEINTAGTYVVQPGDGILLVNVAGLVTIQLPDVRTWVQQNANQPATGFTRSIQVKDIGGNAQNFNIVIVPFSGQRIDGIGAQILITVNRASAVLYPMIDLSGWIVQATAVGGPGANGDVFKAGNNTFTGANDFQGSTTALTMSLDDNSTHVATTAFVQGQNYVSDLDLTAYAPLDSPQFINNPTAPTPMAANSDGSIATTFYVNRGFQPLDGDLTAIAALAGTNTIYYRSGANAWSPVVVSAPLTFAGGVLTTSAGGGNVTSVGTPTNGQIAQWTGPTSIQGIAVASLGFQPLDGDLTALSGLSGTNTIYYRSGADIWSPVVVGSGMNFAGGVLTATGTATGNVNSTGGGYSATVLTGYADATGNLIRAITVGTGLNLTGVNLTCTVSTAGLATIASPVFTGDPQAPTPPTADNDTSIATTAFVKAQGYITSATAASTFQPLDGDLTSLSGASSTNVMYYRSAANTWSPVTIGSGLTFTTGILSSAGAGGNVSSVGTPVSGQWAQWTSSSQIQGVALASTPWVQKAGDVMTGNLTVALANPSVFLQKAASGGIAGVYGFMGTALRWEVDLGDSAIETGGPTGSGGSDFNIIRYKNDGGVIDNTLSISRLTGVVTTGTQNIRQVGLIGDGLNLSGGANQGLIAGAGASADVGVAITSKGNSAVYLYNANFARLVSQFAANAAANTSLNFTTQLGLTQIGNNPAGNPINFLSPVTMTENLTVAKATHPGVILNKTAIGQVNYVSGQFNGLDRWQLQVGDNSAEAGGNAGSNLALLRMNDAGVFIGTALTVVRATGVAIFEQSPLGPTPTAGDNSTKLATTAFVQGASFISNVVIQKFVTSTTYVPTPGMKFCIVECVGGGGGGGSTDGVAAQLYVGAGGGAGGYTRSRLTAAQIGASKAVTIGGGGAGGTTVPGSSGGSGGDTILAGLVTAKGGSGGLQGGLGYNPVGGAGGTIVGGLGDVICTGPPGFGGFYNSANNTIASKSGAGGSSVFGGGGVPPPSTSAAGGAASLYGSGGGGAYSADGNDYVGGAGSAGLMIITEFL